ncbi:MAG: site-specific integrase [Gammaproteobacteria bacterium]|nr:site-specific integrase [Gammaproteobacteria bacterium]
MARKQAQIILGKIATGIDPIAEKQAQHYYGITLAQAFEDYLQARKSLKASTALDYRRGLNQVLSDWMDKPLTSITKEMIVKRHTEHGEKRSQARANLAMRILRAIFNFAINEYEDAKGKPVISDNPVKRLSHARSWYRIERRHSVIKRHELATWYEGLMGYTPYHYP